MMTFAAPHRFLRARRGDLRISLIDACNFRCAYCMPAEGCPGQARRAAHGGPDRTRRALVRLPRRRLDQAHRRRADAAGRARRDRPPAPRHRRRHRSLHHHQRPASGRARARAARGRPRPRDGLVRFADPAPFRRRDATRRPRCGHDRDRGGRGCRFQPGQVNCVVIDGTNRRRGRRLRTPRAIHGAACALHRIHSAVCVHAWSAPRSFRPQRYGPDRRRVPDRCRRPDAASAAPSNGGPATRFRSPMARRGRSVSSRRDRALLCDVHRVRVTADGQLRACLFALEETDLRTPAAGGRPGRARASDPRHRRSGSGPGTDQTHRTSKRPSRSMSQIGG